MDRLRRRIVVNATGLFAHTRDPMADTLRYRGDPGLVGPGSITWEIMADPATFIGGIRALLIQAAHPEVVAGVVDHSSYRDDPFGRLSRTSAYVTATSYGAMPEVEVVVASVRTAHAGVRGRSHRGLPYTASAPGLAAWVHNSLTESFLTANQAYGRRVLSPAEADAFVREQMAVGRLLDADPLPDTAGKLRQWVAQHPDVAPSPGMADTVEFLQAPPLDPAIRAVYRTLAGGAAAIIPPRLTATLGVSAGPSAIVTGRLVTAALRWAIGQSPRWRMALLRVGAPVPEELFKQKVPFEELRRRR